MRMAYAVLASRCNGQQAHLLSQNDSKMINECALSLFARCEIRDVKHWVTQHYLRSLNRPEVHIYDRDVPQYADSIAEVNLRTDNSWGVQTNKYEMECYLHADAIKEAFDVDIVVADQPDADGKAVPKLFAEAYSAKQKYDGIMKDGPAKTRLADKAFPLMTAARLAARDPGGEVEGWLRRIGGML